MHNWPEGPYTHETDDELIEWYLRFERALSLLGHDARTELLQREGRAIELANRLKAANERAAQAYALRFTS